MICGEITPQKMTIFKIFDVQLYLSVQKWPKRLKTLSARFRKAWDPYFHLSWPIKWSLNYLSEISFKSKNEFFHIFTKMGNTVFVWIDNYLSYHLSDHLIGQLK